MSNKFSCEKKEKQKEKYLPRDFIQTVLQISFLLEGKFFLLMNPFYMY